MKAIFTTLFSLTLFIQSLNAEISVIADYNFSKGSASSAVTVKNGTLNVQSDHLKFDGKTMLTLPSGLAQKKKNFGIEFLVSVSDPAHFGFIGAVAGKSKRNEGFGIALDNPNIHTYRPDYFGFIGILSGIGYFGKTEIGSVKQDQKISVAAVVEHNNASTLYFNGVAYPARINKLAIGNLATLYLGGHPFDAAQNKGFLKGKIYQARTFTFQKGAFSPSDLLSASPQNKTVPEPRFSSLISIDQMTLGFTH